MQRADQLFPVSAYRGLMREPQDTGYAWQWFSDDPAIASTYAREGAGGNVMPARINPENMLEIDAGGAPYMRIPTANFSQVLRNAIRGKEASTDRVAGEAYKLGYDGVIFRNIRDALSTYDNTPVSTVYVSFKPERIRSRFAMFDPDRTDVADLLAGTAVALPAGGGLLSREGRR